MTSDIFKYKAIAHDIIGDLVESGMPKKKVYKKISYFLRIPGQDAHISSMNTLSQIRRAIKLLNYLRYKRLKQGKIKRYSAKELFLSGHKSTIK